ncbi:hypothetical protein VP1G_09421 [Cytospora mali]|uniref:Uncharacterized protein n=1 Tax=Cytospora mali TaxID=578113 RepID=A0A194VE52_CYTMA|nr:hypothetical protein VP1G_09421 [Valsa mali var. pyri (nom. inval.)]
MRLSTFYGLAVLAVLRAASSVHAESQALDKDTEPDARAEVIPEYDSRHPKAHHKRPKIPTYHQNTPRTPGGVFWPKPYRRRNYLLHIDRDEDEDAEYNYNYSVCHHHVNSRFYVSLYGNTGAEHQYLYDSLHGNTGAEHQHFYISLHGNTGAEHQYLYVSLYGDPDDDGHYYSIFYVNLDDDGVARCDQHYHYHHSHHNKYFYSFFYVNLHDDGVARCARDYRYLHSYGYKYFYNTLYINETKSGSPAELNLLFPDALDPLDCAIYLLRAQQSQPWAGSLIRILEKSQKYTSCDIAVFIEKKVQELRGKNT